MLSMCKDATHLKDENQNKNNFVYWPWKKKKKCTNFKTSRGCLGTIPYFAKGKFKQPPHVRGLKA